MQTANLLTNSTSPYLLQHKDNPVHWRPWNNDSLKYAQEQDKPIFLSIGYAACHWCHVMAHESFEDQEVADVLNEHFVSIKVDREERPDIDYIYMTALHYFGEQGGWPLTMFLTPDGKPYWGGTYFPKEPKWGKPGLIAVLKELSRLYREDANAVTQNKTTIMARLEFKQTYKIDITSEQMKSAAERLYGIMDSNNGGPKSKQKFPQCSLLNFLWRSSQKTSDNSLINIVLLSLERMCQGGIYDHLGGGFARYTVDEIWFVPHFEKMLYDNAQLLDLLHLAYKQTGNSLYFERISETIDWLEREMLTEQGAFSSSLDADSEGEEGKFYVWSEAEIDELLSNGDAASFKSLYGVQPHGNWEENKSILNRLKTMGPEFDDISNKLSNEKSILLNARNKRIHPDCDDKVLADWNGLMIGALARISLSGISSEKSRQMAESAFDFINSNMTVDGEPGHSWRDGSLIFPGQLSDYASMIYAALALYELEFDSKYIDYAEKLVGIICRKFHDKQIGGFFMTTSDADDLIIRPKFSHDDATPNANGLLCNELVRLYHLTGNERYKSLYEEIINVNSSDMMKNIFGSATLLSALHFSLNVTSVVLVGSDTNECESMLSAVRKQPNPNIIAIVSRETSSLPANHPAKNKQAVEGKTTAYICTGQTCQEPITEVSVLEEKLAALF